ncbi:DUF983 domain-containing protein [Methylobacterium organophilum]|uniref:DUF983 domain-containing protein n=1 Tax=Methylobacterium organophilum TaxID=410 RepID=A0ABQ4T6X3_METOR|nr:hypothetical protein LKMONMHP_1061 [Methylobacterium organophilum]
MDTPPTEIVPARPPVPRSMLRGFLNRCPECGKGHMFGRFLKVRPSCECCGLEMQGHRADDLPPYLVIFIVGHIVGYLALKVEMNYDVPLWASMLLWPLLALVMALALLQPVKGAVVGLQYALGMHGFGKLPPDAERHGSQEAGFGPGDHANPAAGFGRL